MKSNVQISRGIESLFGTRDENIRLIEEGLHVRTRLLNDSLEIEGDERAVERASSILNDYAALVKEGAVVTVNGRTQERVDAAIDAVLQTLAAVPDLLEVRPAH